MAPGNASLPLCWQRPRGHRAVATRYDKLVVRYEGTVLVAAINEWL